MGKAGPWHKHGMAKGSAQASTGKHELGGRHRAKQKGRQSLWNREACDFWFRKVRRGGLRFLYAFFTPWGPAFSVCFLYAFYKLSVYDE